jgi:hypothetical protein
MKVLGFGRFALTSCVAAAMLCGCGVLQPPMGTTGAMPQTSAIAMQADRGKSWMLPGAKNDDLLYVSKLTKVLIYSYPSDKVVGLVTGFEYATGLCSDRDGNVWVTDSQTSEISEFAHGGTKPIAILSDAQEPTGCAVDPRSGDLAVANYADNVFVYPHGRGNPGVYTAPDLYFMQFCSYDGSGNLFVDGYRDRRGLAPVGILKLSYGDTRLQRFEVGPKRNLHSAGPLQWDGRSVVMGYAGKPNNKIYRISDLGSTGKITKRIELAVPAGGYIPGDLPFVLNGGKIIGAYEVYPERYYIAWWLYPRGGTAVKEFEVHGKYFPAGLALSVAP